MYVISHCYQKTFDAKTFVLQVGHGSFEMLQTCAFTEVINIGSKFGPNFKLQYYLNKTLIAVLL